MKRYWARKILKIVAIVVLVIALVGFIVMQLWNWLLPGLFGWQPISYLQAVGILILSRILIGGFRGRGGGPSWHWRRRTLERWEKMTPEEREKFRQGLRGRP